MSTTTTYVMEALNLYDTINIKAIRNLFSGRVLDSTPAELQVQYGDNSYLFVYRFGCLVFFNVTPQQRELEISKLQNALGAGLTSPTSENYEVRVGESTRVEFEYVELKKLALDNLRLTSATLGQSSALEYFEVQTERMLAETSSLMRDLAQGKSIPIFGGERFLRIIGSAASSRQAIISSLAILDPPELTWKSKELEKLYFEVQENFDIGTRFKTLDRKLSLIQDNIEVLADLATKGKSTLLEFLIVVLIVVEIALGLLTKF